MFQMNVKTMIAITRKNCEKGTQKGAKNMIWESVYLKSKCAYKHLQPTKTQDHEELKVKVKALQKAVQEITKKLIKIMNSLGGLGENVKCNDKKGFKY